MSSNDTVMVDEEQDKLYVYIASTSTYTNAETKCSSMQPVPGATTTGHPVVFNTYSEQVGAQAACRCRMLGRMPCLLTERLIQLTFRALAPCTLAMHD